MRDGVGRLLLPLGALLLAAVLASALALQSSPPSLDRARREARAAAVERLGAAGVASDLLLAGARGPVIEELEAGYPPDDDTPARGGTGAGLAFPLAALLGALALAVAGVVAGRLDADIELVAGRTEDAGSAGRIATSGLAFRESVRLAESIRAGLAAAVAAPGPPPREDTGRLRSHLLASVSHDLRSPLNSILGFSELLLRDAEGPLDDQLRPRLLAIRAAGKRELRLVHQILEVARWQAGRTVLEPRPAVVAELLRDAVDELRRTHELPPELEIETRLQAGMQPVLVDDLRVAEAIAQLLGEAVAGSNGAARQHPIRLEASDRGDPDGRHLVITIDVPGGLRPGVATSVNAAFRVLAPGDLGLAVPLARALIDLHSGTLAVEERPARLVVTIPVGSTKAPR